MSTFHFKVSPFQTDSHSTQWPVCSTTYIFTPTWAPVRWKVNLCVCVWCVQVERKKLEKQMGDLGLDMDDKDNVRTQHNMTLWGKLVCILKTLGAVVLMATVILQLCSQLSSGGLWLLLLPAVMFTSISELLTGTQLISVVFLLYLQSHYAQQGRRSRSVTKKRKREASAPPTSKVRSQSASRPPRDQSGLRDVKVRNDIVHSWIISFSELYTCRDASRLHFLRLIVKNPNWNQHNWFETRLKWLFEETETWPE